jgi:hypothetical protein
MFGLVTRIGPQGLWLGASFERASKASRRASEGRSKIAGFGSGVHKNYCPEAGDIVYDAYSLAVMKAAVLARAE